MEHDETPFEMALELQVLALEVRWRAASRETLRRYAIGRRAMLMEKLRHPPWMLDETRLGLVIVGFVVFSDGDELFTSRGPQNAVGWLAGVVEEQYERSAAAVERKKLSWCEPMLTK